MSYPNYTVDGKPVCQHIFCDHRVSRMFATHKVVQVSQNGREHTTLVCDQHLPIIQQVLNDTDTVESLTIPTTTAKV